MAASKACSKLNQPVMGLCYYCYFKACYFAGLYRRAHLFPLPDNS